MRSVDDLAVAGRRVLIRSDLNVPLDGGRITDDGRVRASVPTIRSVPVAFATDVVGESARATTDALRDGEVALLENLRFEPGETTDDAAFAAQLAGLGDCYVGDAFGAVHRAHASVSALPRTMEHAAGYLVQAELDVLRRLTTPDRPYVVVLGGSKVSDKLAVITNLLGTVDRLL
ncbi:MAG: phosphoglycerate kinase, partial [Frankia sp.]|nr:phosphoglycerate kinase [Frankia sp.]